MGLNRWLGCIENPRTGREAVEARSASAGDARLPSVLVVGAGPAGLQAAIAAAGAGHRVTVCERDAEAGGQVRLAASVPNRAELGDMIRNQVTECRRLGVVDRVRRRRRRGRRRSRTVAGPRDRRHRRGAASPVVGRPRTSTNVCRRPRRARRRGGAVRAAWSSIDEIGFHHATSVAELLADRGCAVEVVTPGMVVGQDLGITLDMEDWWMRATAKGIVQSTDLVPMGFDGIDADAAAPPDRARRSRAPRTGWCSPCRPRRPTALYHELKAAGDPAVHRVR